MPGVAAPAPSARVDAHAPPGERASARARQRAASAPPRLALSEVLPRPGPTTAARGGVAGPPTPQGPGQGRPLVPPALATAGRDPSARRGLQCACASAARPSPARRSSVAGAPQARRGSRAAGASGEGRPTQGQRVSGRDRGAFRGLSSRAPRRACDLTGTTP